jgi:dTDP-4-amino-4,6-dideoxygalactose transaminase
MRHFLPYGGQDIDDHDIAAVTRALRGEIITRGPLVEKFEQEVASYCGARYAVAFNSGSSALAAAYHVIDLTEYDRVVIPPNTFVSTASAAAASKATPVLVDIDKTTGNICLEALDAELKKPQSRGRVIIAPVHFAGIAIDMQRLEQLLRPHMVVIEDAAHALGSCYPSGERVGSCRYSTMCIFSFHPLKNITTGEGGMVTTNDEALYERLRRFRDMGIERQQERFVGAERGPWIYEVQELTNNSHLTAFQAALGSSQLQKLKGFIEKRKELIDCYKKLLGNEKRVQLLLPKHDATTAFHIAVFQIDFAAFQTTRTAVMNEMKARKIGSQVHYIPLYRHPYFIEKWGDLSAYFPECEAYYSKALTLPLYVRLQPTQVQYIMENLFEVLGVASNTK